MHHAIAAAILTLLLALSLVACSGSSAPVATETQDPTGTPRPTILPTRLTPIPTLNPTQIEATRTVQLATIHASLPTPRPIQIIVPMVPPPLPVPTFEPLPVPTFESLPFPTFESLPFPTFEPLPVPTFESLPFPTFEPLPFPTFEPITLPTFVFTPPTIEPITLPTFAPLPPTPAVSVAASEVMEFAQACGVVKDSPEQDLVVWLEEAEAVAAAPALEEYWAAYLDQFRLQVSAGGPNSYAQMAYTREQLEIVRMSPDLRSALVQNRCLLPEDVDVAYVLMDAGIRLSQGIGQGEDVDVEEFAQACADIQVTSPVLDTPEAIPRHLSLWWDRLSPPPDLADYHAAVADFYAEWIVVGEPLLVSYEAQTAVVEAAMEMETEVQGALLAVGCGG